MNQSLINFLHTLDVDHGCTFTDGDFARAHEYGETFKLAIKELSVPLAMEALRVSEYHGWEHLTEYIKFAQIDLIELPFKGIYYIRYFLEIVNGSGRRTIAYSLRTDSDGNRDDSAVEVWERYNRLTNLIGDDGLDDILDI